MIGPPPPSWAVDPQVGQVFELADGLWSLRLPLPWDHVRWVNAYVVAREDGIMLVDCGGAGDPSTIPALERTLRRSGHEIADVRVLVGTHAHSDHIGIYGDEMASDSGPWRAAETFSFLRHLRLAAEATRETLPDGTFRHRLVA